VDDERIFIYLRLRLGEHVLARTKIREFGGLQSLLADFLRAAITDGLDVSKVDLSRGVAPVMEYVDAAGDVVLMTFRVDLARQEHVVKGAIPARYRQRMLDPAVSACSPQRFVERAAPDMPPQEKAALASWVGRSASGLDLLARIRDVIDADGRFEVHIPLGDENA
jgi:hypothetical protein